MISFGAWNVRGINKTRKQLEVAKFLSYHNLSLVGLLETKVKRKGLGALYLRMFPNWCITTNLAWPEGGRIIVAWKSVDAHVDILSSRSQFIHMEVSPVNGTPFMCTFVYGSNNRHERQHLFEELGVLSQTIASPWIILGDFNCVAQFDERLGS